MRDGQVTDVKNEAVIQPLSAAFTTPVLSHLLISQVHIAFNILLALIIHIVLQILIFQGDMLL